MSEPGDNHQKSPKGENAWMRLSITLSLDCSVHGSTVANDGDALTVENTA